MLLSPHLFKLGIFHSFHLQNIFKLFVHLIVFHQNINVFFLCLFIIVSFENQLFSQSFFFSLYLFHFLFNLSSKGIVVLIAFTFQKESNFLFNFFEQICWGSFPKTFWSWILFPQGLKFLFVISKILLVQLILYLILNFDEYIFNSLRKKWHITS